MRLSFRHQVALLVALSMVGAVGPLLVFYERDLRRGVLSDRVEDVLREARDLENVLAEAQAEEGPEGVAAELREEAAEFEDETGAAEVLFTDARGTIVGHSDPRRIGDSDPEAALKRRVIRSGRTLSVEEEDAGVTYHEIVAPIDLGGGRRLALEIEDDMSELDAAISQARRAGLLPSLLALVIALPAAAILTTRFVESARRREQRVEARFRSLVQEASDVIVVIDASGRTSYVSPAVERVLGYRSEERIGKKALDLVHPDDLDTVNKLFSDVAKAPGAATTAEARVRHRDGSWRWIEGTATNLLADPNVGGIVLNYRDIGERKALEESLTHRAFHDSLTNLANRELFKDRVEHALSRRKVRGDSLAVLFIDLDDFKNVNDSLGHAVGDLLLMAVGERLRESLRPSDTLGRLGGDEFGVLLEDMQHAADAVLIAERITETLHQPFNLGGKQVLMRASIGIVADLSLDETADELVNNADTAMYAAKTGGKGSYAVYEPHMHQALLRRQALKGELQRALDRDEFTLRYQPIVALDTGTVVGVEALVRWGHPERGLLPPSEFLVLVEESGLMVALGRWVLKTACRAARTWAPDGVGTSPFVSVNLSVRQLQDEGLVRDVAQAVESDGLDPSRLVVEITESALMLDADATQEVLSRLKDVGVGIALDDFGSGHSSLGYLRRFPVDIIKIDGSFVAGTGGTLQDSPFVRAILKLAQSLDLRVSAEWIESTEQLDALRGLGCQWGQGYHLWPPLDAERLASVIGGRRNLQGVAR